MDGKKKADKLQYVALLLGRTVPMVSGHERSRVKRQAVK
jgi:hypothetical protein